MPRSIRKQLLNKADSALKAVTALDTYLYEMDMLARGRQPAIDEAKPMLIQTQELVRSLWTALREAL